MGTPDMASIIVSYNAMAKRELRQLNQQKRISSDEKIAEVLTDKQAASLSLIEEQIFDEKTPESIRACPECGRNFLLLQVEGLEIDCCRYCRSYWFDKGELARIAETSEDIPDTTLRSRKSRFKCPDCGQIMNEHIYITGNNLLVDRCPDHGVYLESGELKRAYDALKL